MGIIRKTSVLKFISSKDILLHLLNQGTVILKKKKKKAWGLGSRNSSCLGLSDPLIPNLLTPVTSFRSHSFRPSKLENQDRLWTSGPANGEEISYTSQIRTDKAPVQSLQVSVPDSSAGLYSHPSAQVNLPFEISWGLSVLFLHQHIKHKAYCQQVLAVISYICKALIYQCFSQTVEPGVLSQKIIPKEEIWTSTIVSILHVELETEIFK